MDKIRMIEAEQIKRICRSFLPEIQYVYMLKLLKVRVNERKF